MDTSQAIGSNLYMISIFINQIVIHRLIQSYNYESMIICGFLCKITFVVNINDRWTQACGSELILANFTPQNLPTTASSTSTAISSTNMPTWRRSSSSTHRKHIPKYQDLSKTWTGWWQTRIGPTELFPLKTKTWSKRTWLSSISFNPSSTKSPNSSAGSVTNSLMSGTQTCQWNIWVQSMSKRLWN